jgi:hypothetical protein
MRREMKNPLDCITMSAPATSRLSQDKRTPSMRLCSKQASKSPDESPLLGTPSGILRLFLRNKLPLHNELRSSSRNKPVNFCKLEPNQ